MVESKTTKLFAYGTLNIHAIQQAIWGTQKAGKPYTLLDYELKMYTNYIFYVERKFGEKVSGKLYELTDDELAQSDIYEGDSYEQVKIKQGDVEFITYVRKVAQ